MNGLITRLILAFVGASLTFTLLPLLESGGGTSLLGAVDRGKSLVVYAAFLVVFGVFVFPGFVSRGRTSGLWPWMTLAGYLLVFAGIPLVFTAYISGVSAPGLISIAALCGIALGVPLVVARVLPRWTTITCHAIGAIFLFALPGALLYLETVARPVPEALVPWSTFHWLHRIATLREVPDPWPFLVLGSAVWVAAVVPFGWSRRAGKTAVLVALFALTGGAAGNADSVERLVSQPGSAHVVSRAGGRARAGMRTPLTITLPRADGVARVSAGLDIHEVPRDGVPHRVLITIGRDARRLRIETEGGADEVPLPVTLVPPVVVLAGWLFDDDVAARAAGMRDGVRLDPAAVPTTPGSLEAFDVLVMTEERFDTAAAEARDAVRRWTALGRRLVLTGPSATRSRAPLGLGAIHRFAMGQAPAAFPPPPPLRPSALDVELTQTFAPPGWQEMDLSALLLFAVIYHVAFLLAFLLPMFLDSRKALGVYLVSVGFVVALVAALAWNVLGTIFLRDNQVYTHAVTLMVAGAGDDPRLVSRQFLCFASMSSESRDLAFPASADLTVYRAGGPTRRVVWRRDAREAVLDGVDLDRFAGKVVVRADRDDAMPLRLVGAPGQDAKLDLQPVDDAPDPLGVRDARILAAYWISGGRLARRFEIQGRRLIDAGPAGSDPMSGEVQVFFRRLVGHFTSPLPSYLLVHMEGLARPDDDGGYLWSRDRGGYLVIPGPPR